MGIKLLERFSFWHNKDASSCIDVICLLPNGICITFPSLRADTPLHAIKHKLWGEADRYALATTLKPPARYVFSVVSQSGGTEELINETLSLFDIKAVRPYLKVSYPYSYNQLNYLAIIY